MLARNPGAESNLEVTFPSDTCLPYGHHFYKPAALFLFFLFFFFVSCWDYLNMLAASVESVASSPLMGALLVSKKTTAE